MLLIMVSGHFRSFKRTNDIILINNIITYTETKSAYNMNYRLKFKKKTITTSSETMTAVCDRVVYSHGILKTKYN